MGCASVDVLSVVWVALLVVKYYYFLINITVVVREARPSRLAWAVCMCFSKVTVLSR